MNFLIWNCRGAGKPSARAYYSRLMVKHQVSMAVVLETQLSGRGLAKVELKLPRGMSRYLIPAVGWSDGIIAF